MIEYLIVRMELACGFTLPLESVACVRFIIR
jgi:hypothetical protein